jgi:hypothetical protein
VAEPTGPFLVLDAVDAVELGELLGFLSDWLCSDPNRLDASLCWTSSAASVCCRALKLVTTPSLSM